MNRFNPGCCGCCKRTIIAIAIYDEADPGYVPGGGLPPAFWDGDLADWNAFIAGVSESNVRAGLIVPTIEDSFVKPGGAAWPADTDRSEINHVTVGFKTPRVTAQEIVDFFELIRTTPTPLGGSGGPELLRFVLDNSGSITVSQYATELTQAKSTLQAAYPQMEILDEIINAEERWLRDLRRATEGITCG